MSFSLAVGLRRALIVAAVYLGGFGLGCGIAAARFQAASTLCPLLIGSTNTASNRLFTRHSPAPGFDAILTFLFTSRAVSSAPSFAFVGTDVHPVPVVLTGQDCDLEPGALVFADYREHRSSVCGPALHHQAAFTALDCPARELVAFHTEILSGSQSRNGRLSHRHAGGNS
jgi:hypothetical protein